MTNLKTSDSSVSHELDITTRQFPTKRFLICQTIPDTFEDSSKTLFLCCNAGNSVSNEMCDWWFVYLLVGKVGGTKNEMEVQEFQTPVLISSSNQKYVQSR